MTSTFQGIAALPHLGVIRAEGDDAARFLHGQLTQDFALLNLQQARLAAFLSVKGRIQASFIGFKRSEGDIVLICSRDLLAATLKRLSMFVLRAKVRLSDASDAFTLRGLAGDAIKTVAGSALSTGEKRDLGPVSVVGLAPALDQPRALWLAPAGTPAPPGPALDTALWLWGDVRSGVATISAPVVDALVPQMLNYESVGGVNFKKGCYPGQEVVARSQFRGTLKRRGFVGLVAGDAAAGAPVFSPHDPDQPCGLVAQAAAAPEGGCAVIVSLQLACADGPLHIGTPQGPALTLQALPYPLLEDL